MTTQKSHLSTSGIAFCSVLSLALSVCNQQSARSAQIVESDVPQTNSLQISNAASVAGASNITVFFSGEVGTSFPTTTSVSFAPQANSQNFQVTGVSPGAFQEFVGGAGTITNFSFPFLGGNFAPDPLLKFDSPFVFANIFPGGSGATFLGTSISTPSLVDVGGSAVFSATAFGIFTNETDNKTFLGSVTLSSTFNGLSTSQVFAAGESSTGVSSSWSATFSIAPISTPEASMVPGLALLAGSAIFLRKKSKKD